MAIANHLIYLFFSILFTVLVGRTLFTNGHHFLMECWGDEKVANAVNRFLLVGFYLMNLSFVFIILRLGETGTTLKESMEVLAGRVGFVAIVMGGMHFNNLVVCEVVRRFRATT